MRKIEDLEHFKKRCNKWECIHSTNNEAELCTFPSIKSRVVKLFLGELVTFCGCAIDVGSNTISLNDGKCNATLSHGFDAV